MVLSEEGRQPFDLLIADVVMPGLSGVELVSRMRELISSPPPVLYMSGDVRPALNDAAGTIGGDPILAKPFAAEQLLEAIDATLA
jgi:DNA-binding response OmpR family regulator